MNQATVTFSITDEQISGIMDVSRYSIEYWFSETDSNTEGPADTLFLKGVDTENRSVKWDKVTADTITTGISKALDPSFKINPGVRQSILSFTYGDDTYCDEVAADVIIQAGLFGKIVYG